MSILCFPKQYRRSSSSNMLMHKILFVFIQVYIDYHAGWLPIPTLSILLSSIHFLILSTAWAGYFTVDPTSTADFLYTLVYIAIISWYTSFLGSNLCECERSKVLEKTILLLAIVSVDWSPIFRQKWRPAIPRRRSISPSGENGLRQKFRWVDASSYKRLPTLTFLESIEQIENSHRRNKTIPVSEKLPSRLDAWRQKIGNWYVAWQSIS